MRKSFSNIILYSLVLFASNFVATYLAQVWIDGVHQLMSGSINEVTDGYANAMYLLYYPVSIILPIVSLRYVFRYRMHTVIEGNNRHGWIKNAMLFALPGEAVRFLICFRAVGNFNMGGFFAVIPTVWFDTYWLKWTNRYTAVRELYQFRFLDCFGYTLCYVLYLLPVLFVLALSFKSRYDLEKAEFDDRCALLGTKTQ